MRVALLGLGLIGGSLARALRRGRDWSVVAWTPSGRGPSAALAEGVLDGAPPTPEAAIDGADLVVLAGPPRVCLEHVDLLAGTWRAAWPVHATVTDVASTKATLVERAGELGLPFVGGHPMAGREASGYEASSAELFAGRPWVVVPASSARPLDLERVEAMVTAVGARPVRMEAAAHDAAVAAISHLPLLVSAALVEAVAGPGAAPRGGAVERARLAATGWRDTTRLALGDTTMGADILATNAGPVSAELARLREVLGSWAAELERTGGPDPRALEERLARARAGLAEMRRIVEGEDT